MYTKFKKGVDYVGVTTSFFCHDGKGKFVMAKRSKNARDERGKWDTGGGGLDFGYNIDDHLRKEIKEEYCADVLEYKFLGFRDVHRVNDEGKPTHWISLDFKVLVDPAQVKIGEPHKFDDLGWFTLESIPKEVHSTFSTFVEKYKEKINQ